MPYKTLKDLPAPVREHLPKHAQEIYKEAYNNAWDSYADRADREEVAHKVAWSAVKQVYVKQGDDWVEK